VLGVNNRNLKTFEVDINTSLELLPLMPEHVVKISESGINSPDKILTLKSAGFQGFLMGEYFMRFPLPAKACEEFIKKLKTRGNEN
jgi:indole-3-glycerol phosphate synthase